MEEGRNPFEILIDKNTGSRPLGRRRLRWEDNIVMDIKEIEIKIREIRLIWLGIRIFGESL